ncbi:3'-5' exonuclease [Bacillus sp. SL00103]
MTIHRAKGLEFQTVYITCVSTGHCHMISHSMNSETVMKKPEEERRLLYVAMTRAEQSLYLSVPSFRRGNRSSLAFFISSSKEK